jgi:hypothetical protein
MANTVLLSKPLKTHDGEVSLLTLRDLDAADIVAMKSSPFQVIRMQSGEVELIVKYDVMMQYLSRLSNLDPILLGKLGGVDFQVACNKVGDIWNGLGE